MDSKSTLAIAAFLPATIALSWQLGMFLFRLKSIIKDHKAEKLLRKMTNALGLHLKKSRGGSWYITLKEDDSLVERAVADVPMISESALELKKNLVKTEELLFGEEDAAIKNLFFQKTDAEIEVLADLAAR